ncbi:MAG: DUF932 domain-containing protein [Candidatus Marinimicrobia bacterium]|jgi:hypothetical protein|nr:DUF932 domain-containing protein [Candidatus Neomarinimicrobiota bacterium]MBT4362089.1 DUF932 domain-containing protein [Candidatus Neomarinimicrobiota bacterium]
MDLNQFMFPVEERPVAIHDGAQDIMDIENRDTFLSADYKALVRADTNEPISIVRNTYQVVPNRVLIMQLMEELVGMDTPFVVEPSHSFVMNNKMRLQIKFPELIVTDDDSDIALSLYLHNSFDGSEGIRVFFGAIRGICQNGMVFGKSIAKAYHRHTSGFELCRISDSLSEITELMPGIQTRINELIQSDPDNALYEDIEKQLGKRMLSQVHESSQKHTSQWDVLNAITYIISHVIDQRLRARYQMAASRVFAL